MAIKKYSNRTKTHIACHQSNQLYKHCSLSFLLCNCLFLDLKAMENERTCTLPEASGSAPQEIDPTKENEVLFTYSVHWEVSDCCMGSQ